MSDRADMRIMVVDDDEAMIRLIGAILTGSGFGVPRSVGTGKEALELADECDVILLDQMLPDAAGIDLVASLRARSTRPAVVLITAHGNESLAAAALRAGAEDYLIKDQSLTGLLPEVMERVRRNRALREALAAAERDLVHAERRAAIGQMNVTLHHTINNPLMAASAEVELLLGPPGSLTAEQRDSLESVKRSLERIFEILQRASTLRHDATAEYLDGVSMIDLSRRTAPRPAHRGEAVIHLPDEDTARVISLLLRHAGFAVKRVETVKELEGGAGRLGLSLVILAGGPGGSSVDPLGGFRPGATKTYTLVALVAGDGAAARAAGADHVVNLPFDPGTFTNDLLAVMKG